MKRVVILGAFAVIVAGTIAPLAQQGPPPVTRPGYLGEGVTLLPSGWKIAPAGRHLPLGHLPMGLAPSPDGRLIAITTSGYERPALAIFDTKRLQVAAEIPVEHTWLGLVWSPDGTRLFASGSSENAIDEFDWREGRLRAAERSSSVRRSGIPAATRSRTPGSSPAWRSAETADSCSRRSCTASACDASTSRRVRSPGAWICPRSPTRVSCLPMDEPSMCRSGAARRCSSSTPTRWRSATRSRSASIQMRWSSRVMADACSWRAPIPTRVGHQSRGAPRGRTDIRCRRRSGAGGVHAQRALALAGRADAPRRECRQQ